MKNKLLIILMTVPTFALGEEYADCFSKDFSFALTSGFVFKRDEHFKKVYGRGIIDIITADLCCYQWNHIGLGIKSSYWRQKGKTTVLKNHATIQEIPLIGYIRAPFGSHKAQGYVSLGGGCIFLKEKSPIGKVHAHTGIGEAELGFNYCFHTRFYLTGASRVLFTKQTIHGTCADVGGIGLRAGLGVTF